MAPITVSVEVTVREKKDDNPNGRMTIRTTTSSGKVEEVKVFPFTVEWAKEPYAYSAESAFVPGAGKIKRQAVLVGIAHSINRWPRDDPRPDTLIKRLLGELKQGGYTLDKRSDAWTKSDV